ncbi:MAG: DUF4143 domain-containing protein [Nitrososphaerota archaeon]|uniref:hypothetical protein n=1 Tax=Candidatus Bathycorpusculum sp. TaxID=2994959 RepID=UPI00283139E8|nr:DUF4143 domain-containing protein [Candidatus Termitimicrobium sp.]MCL2432571.1 DUF4143 domain-containing protein [Candidatus Termitimicrobium sp.]MDR0493028.1 DUF4143 domain-containing protein [Nitrososphaerota archaeon]
MSADFNFSVVTMVLTMIFLPKVGLIQIEVYWWRERNNAVDFVVAKGNQFTAIEVKSGRVKSVGDSLIFKQHYPSALSLIIGSVNCDLEDFLLGKKSLFL